MHYAKVHTAQTSLLEAHIIDIEVDLSRGLHAFSIVGLPDKAVEESRDRISAAIKNAGFKSPKQTNQKVVISLAPADLKKEGPSFDVGMALGYLLAADHIKFDPRKKIFLGELSLDGKVRKIPGTLPLVRKAKEVGFEEIYLPEENAAEGSFIEGIALFPIKCLRELIEHLNEKKDPDEATVDIKNDHEIRSKRIAVYPHTNYAAMASGADSREETDFSLIKGQESAKRGLLIAAAGGHSIAMYGPPGTGKTLLAKAFRGILPPLTFEEALEATSIHSINDTLKEALISRPPFRSPHHSSSYTALVGGGGIPKPGEITLAHRGVLFLDEFAEFDRRVIDALRQPLEERSLNISRTKGRAIFPADFILIAALNPCPCGNFGIQGRRCVCSAKDIARYRRKISGPIMDRIDMWVEVSAVDHKDLLEKQSSGQSSRDLEEKVAQAREIQRKRFEKSGRRQATWLNSRMDLKDLGKHILLSPELKKLFIQSAERLKLSARAYHRVAKLARTIADLAGEKEIYEKHLLEALQYRPKIQEY